MQLAAPYENLTLPYMSMSNLFAINSSDNHTALLSTEFSDRNVEALCVSTDVFAFFRQFRVAY